MDLSIRGAEPAETDYVLVACAGEEVVGHAGLHCAGRTPRRAHAMARRNPKAPPGPRESPAPVR